MGIEWIKISNLEAEKIRLKEEKRRNRAIEANAYDEFTEEGKPFFFETIDLIENLLAHEIMKGNLDIDTKILSRIKDKESALNNDDISLMNKNMLMKIIMDAIALEDYKVKYLDEIYIPKEKILDDVFGITIIVENENERKVVKQLLEDNFIVDDEKQMKKKEYKAIHMKFHQNSDPKYPLLECQVKTRLENLSCKEHTIYKVENAIERNLREEGKLSDSNKKVQIELTQSGIKKVYNIIQQYFNEGMFTISSNIPKMWESRFNEKDKIMERKMLSEGQTLKRKYAFLNMDGDSRQEGENR